MNESNGIDAPIGGVGLGERPRHSGSSSAIRVGLACALAGSTAMLGGCGVRRTLTITSEPSGALVQLNDREVGRTPVEVEFLWYGEYDVRLSLDGHEPLVTSAKAKPPLWDTMPLDLAAEMSPVRQNVRLAWHFDLLPAEIDDAALFERATQMRRDVLELSAPRPDADDGSIPE